MDQVPVHEAGTSISGTASPVERDVVPELLDPALAAAATGGHSHQDEQHETRRSSDASTHSDTGVETAMRSRGLDASVSHVSIDYFDPEGINELKRTLTAQSVSAHQNQVHRKHGNGSGDESTVVSMTGGLDSENFDFERFLKDTIQRGGDENSIRARQLGVVFQNLRVQGLGTKAGYQPTVGSVANPSSVADKICELRHPPVRDILSGFEGVVKPGEMLLILGRPGAGCTTLLKALSNQHDEYYNVSGLLHFSGFTSKQIRRHFRGDVIYCPEEDVHFPTLTVEETLKFAVRTRIPNKKARIGGMSRQEFTDTAVNLLTTLFGLRPAKKTRVGNAAIRGISGGERKRVSIAEALATRARVTAWDNTTRGLDSSTALEFVRALRIATDTIGLTTIVSIYQASELLYNVFDKVCVIHEGRMVYFGPARSARQYFIDQGWEPVSRQTTADFLVAVTDPNWRTPRKGFESRVPRTIDEMVEAFQRHPLAQGNKREIASFLAANVILDSHGYDALTCYGLPTVPEAPYEEKERKRQQYIQAARAERGSLARRASPYTISVASQIREATIRRVQILKGDWAASATTATSYTVLAIVVGTLFFDTPEATSAYFSRGGALFFAILFTSLTSYAEIPALYSQRPIVHRHAKAAMYHPFTDAVGLTLVDIPFTVVILILFSVIVYFLIGLQKSAGQFFTFYLFIVFATLTMKAFFRALAACFKQEATAQACGGLTLLALTIYTSYTIPKPTMVGALKWITYINPFFYGFEAILTNEFYTLNGMCSLLVPTGPGYENVTLANRVCTTVGSIPGQTTVDGNRFVNLSYGYSHSHVWRDFGIVVAFMVGFLAVLFVATELNTSSALETAATLYKRGTRKLSVSKSGATDEEKGKIMDQDAASKNEPSEQSDSEMDPARPMSDIFSWKDIQYTVPIGKGETRLLLDSVSGYVVPGKLTALVGESGAGKTTLLNVLAGRTDIGVVTGDRFVNGQPLPHDFQAQTGYCQQLDTHLPETTVREALLFSAKLRQPASVPLAEKEAYVERCLKMCGLEHYADAIVGSLNVEHKKRTTIGVELAARPRLLLFVDEPTSGLDSQSAWAIMTFLRSLAEHGQAILCTIHQPSSELFQLFDRLLLLQKGGQTVYFGDLGQNCSTLIEYFEKNGGRKCEPNENPAEWMLEVIGAGATATTTIDWREAWTRSEEAKKFNIRLDEINEEGRKKPPIQAIHKSDFATSWTYQVYELTIRAYTAYWRSPTYTFSKLFLNSAAGLFVGFTFYKADNTVQGTQNKLFALFMATIIGAAQANHLQVPFIDFRSIYEVRERPSRIYDWTAFLTSMLLVEIPWNIFGSLLLFFCWYWTVGFASSRAGYTFLMLAVMFPLYYTTIGHAIAAMAPTAVISNVVFMAVFAFIVTFCGVLQPYDQMGWWKWMYRVSPWTYLIEGLLGQALGKTEINCSSTEFVTVEPPEGLSCGQYMNPFISVAGGYLQNPNATTNCAFCAYRTSDEFLEGSFNIFYNHHWRDFGFLMVYVCFNAVMIYILTYIFRIRWRR